jgi:hypothetical protein
MSKKPIGDDPFPQLRRRSFFADADPEPDPPRSIVTQADVKAIEVKAATAGTRKRGRPVAPKPWIEAGVSRITWYRRQKAKGDIV